MNTTGNAERSAKRRRVDHGAQGGDARMEQPTAHGDATFALIVCAVFAVIAGFGLLNHEMWRDELQAWLLARSSTSMAELVHLVKAEGHPALWHLLLYPLTRMTGNPAAMQALHLVLATSVVYIVARFAPFPRWQRVFLAGSYLLAYEYAVLSRSYVLGALLLFAVCALFPLRRRSYLPLALPLVLLANTSVYGLILACAVGIGLTVDAWVDWPGWSHFRRRLPFLTAAMVVAGALLSVDQILAEKSPAAGDRTGYGRPDVPSVQWRAAESISLVARAWLPVPNMGSSEWWNTSAFITGGRYALLGAALLSLTLLTLIAGSLLERPVALALLGSGTVAILALAYMYHVGGMRHFGNLFLTLVAALWLGRTTRYLPLEGFPGRIAAVLRRPGRFAFKLILVSQVATAALFYGLDALRPFSSARATAEYLAQMDPPVLILATGSATGVAVSAYLDQPLYYMNNRQFGTYADWRLPWRRSEEALAGLGALVRSGGYDDVVIVADRPVPEWLAAGVSNGWRFDEITRFEKAILRSERFVLFRARPVVTQ